MLGRSSRTAAVVAVALFVGSLAMPASATHEPPVGPVWPPPGGVTWTPDDSIGTAGGSTWSYTDLDMDLFAELWWGPWDDEAVKLSFNGEYADEGEILAFDFGASDLANGVATWTGSTSVEHFVNGDLVTETLPTRFTITVADGPLFDPADLEIDTGVGAVRSVGGDYSVHLAFEAFKGSWQPARDLYNSLSTDPDAPEGQYRSSFGGGFFYKPANTPPVADDLAVDTLEGQSVAVLLSGSDADDDPIEFAVVTEPSNGTLVGDAPDLVYVPDPDYTPWPDLEAVDSFTFAVHDGHTYSDLATVSITIHWVNQAPVANDDEAWVQQYSTVVVDVLANDTDREGDALTIEDVSEPTAGTVTVNDGLTVTYTPDPWFKGEDSFTYTVSDGTDVSEEATVTIYEIPCVEGGENGPVSGPVDTVVEPIVGAVDPSLAEDVHVVNCTVVTEVEDYLPLP